MEFKQRSLMQLAQLICGNGDPNKSLFRYRSSSYLTEFAYSNQTHHLFQYKTATRSNSKAPPVPFQTGPLIPIKTRHSGGLDLAR